MSEEQSQVTQQESSVEDGVQDLEAKAVSDVSDPFAELSEAFSAIDEGQTSVPDGEDILDQDVKSAEAIEETEQESSDPKDDSSQYQYWQSQADTRSKELNEVLSTLGVRDLQDLQNNYSDLRSVAPIARYIRENPDILNVVEQSLSSGQPVGQTPMGDQQRSLKRPEKPNKPDDYDPIDAYSDPQSKSYRYRDELENYRDGMVDYYEGQNQQMQRAYAAQQQEAVTRQQMMSLRTQLAQTHGFTDNDAEKFISDMSSPESITLDNLVDLWKMKNAPNKDDVVSQQKVAQMQRQKDKLSMPKPVGVTPGSNESVDRSIEDRLMDAMVSDHKKSNPWT